MVAPQQLMHAHEGRADVLASILLLPQEYNPLLIVSWKLTFEMFFYAIFAVILRAKRGALLSLLGVWAALQIVLALTLHGASNPYVGFLGTPLPLEFIIGAGIGSLFRLGTMPLARSLGAIDIVVSLIVCIASATPGVSADLGMNGLSRVLQFGMPAALIVYGAVGWEGLVGSIAPSWGVALGDASLVEATDRRAAVHDDALARDERAGPRCEHHRDARDVVDDAEAADGILLRHERFHFRIFVQCLSKIRLDDARCDRIDADVLRPPFDGEIARELKIGGFRKAIGAQEPRAF